MKVTLTRVYRSDKNKEGKPYVNKKGKPFERVSIKTQEHGDTWLSGFGANWNRFWKEGEVVEIDVEKKGDFWNFSKVDPMDAVEDRIAILETKVAFLEGALKGTQTPQAAETFTPPEPPTPPAPPIDEIRPEDIPY